MGVTLTSSLRFQSFVQVLQTIMRVYVSRLYHILQSLQIEQTSRFTENLDDFAWFLNDFVTDKIQTLMKTKRLLSRETRELDSYAPKTMSQVML